MAVMTHGSITAAARSLNVSQPSVSRMIERFEHEAGFVAFKRTRGKLIPTPEADTFFSESKIFYRGIDYLNAVAKEIAESNRGYLRVGVFPAYSTAWIAERIDRYVSSKGNILTSIIPLTSENIIDGVARHSMDIGITTRTSDRNDIKGELIWSTDMVCIMPATHRLSAMGIVQPSDLSGENFISLSNLEKFKATIDSTFDELGIERHIRIETPQASSICHLVSRGLGISLVSRQSATEYAHLGYSVAVFKPRLQQRAYLISSTERPMAEVVNGFCEMLRQDYNNTTRD